MKELIFIGDSLTEFNDWQARFEDFGVQNLGCAGEPVEGLLERLSRMRFFGAPDYIFLMTGINNLRRADHDIMQRYCAVAKFLADELKGSRVVLQSILPVLMWVPPSVIEDTNRDIKGVAAELGLEYLDIYRLFLGADGRPMSELFDEDGVHLSRKGYTIWAAALEDFLYTIN